MNRVLLALTLVGGLLVAESAEAQEVRRRAVVVGANHGGSLLESLSYAESDAAKMAELLVDLGGFDRDDVTVLVGPTVSEVAVTLYGISDEGVAADESLFLFYYSGHADEIGLRINGGLLPYAELKGAIRAVPADVHLGILDACRSGSISQVKGASVSAPFLQIDTLGSEGEAWLAASSADEDAQESDLLQGSFFTYYLLSGLRGAADTGDGFVSLDEAYSYAYDRTVARTTGTKAGTQHPTYDYRIQGNGNLALTEVRLATARMTLPADIAGEIAVIRLPERTPVAEVAKTLGKPTTLALEPGTYLLRRRVESGVHEVTINLSEDSLLVVDRWGDTVAEIASLKGEEDGVTDVDDGLAAKSPIVIRVPVRDSPVPWEITLPPVDWEKLQHSPAVAGGLSVVPGLGHFYGKRWARGAVFMVATMGLYSAGFGVAPSGATKALTGPNPLTMLALAFHGWAISDAAWGIERREAFAVRRGVTLSLEGAWGGGGLHASGLAVDFFPAKVFSIGLDRTGFLVETDMTVLHFGTRATVGPTWKRWRLAALATVGSRVEFPREVEGDTQPRHVESRFVLGTGATLRFHLTPRYFAQTEGRVEWVDGVAVPSFGLGMGFHVGR